MPLTKIILPNETCWAEDSEWGVNNHGEFWFRQTNIVWTSENFTIVDARPACVFVRSGRFGATARRGDSLKSEMADRQRAAKILADLRDRDSLR